MSTSTTQNMPPPYLKQSIDQYENLQRKERVQAEHEQSILLRIKKEVIALEEIKRERLAAIQEVFETEAEKKKRVAEIEEPFEAEIKTLLEKYGDKYPVPEVKLKEDMKGQDCALFDMEGFLCYGNLDPKALAIRKEIMCERDADARLLNPHVIIKDMEGTDGKMHHVYIGIKGEKFRAFHRLCEEQRKLERRITAIDKTLEQIPASSPPNEGTLYCSTSCGAKQFTKIRQH